MALFALVLDSPVRGDHTVSGTPVPWLCVLSFSLVYGSASVVSPLPCRRARAQMESLTINLTAPMDPHAHRWTGMAARESTVATP